jgi:hypothetical protein
MLRAMRARHLIIILLLSAFGVASAAGAATAAPTRVVRVPGGGRVVIPADSLTHGARLVAHRRAHHRHIGWGVSLRVAHGRLVGPITLSLPFHGHLPRSTVPSDLAVQLAYYDTRAKRWRSVPGTFDRRTRMVTATIRHLSWWDPRTWDIKGAADMVSQAVGEAVHRRYRPPACDMRRTLPRWFDPNVSDADGLPLLTCAEVWDDHRAAVKIVNNRPYGRYMHFATPVLSASSGQPDGMTARMAAQLGQDLAHPDEVYLPPLSESVIVFGPTSTPTFGTFTGVVDVRSVLVDVDAYGLAQAGSKVQKWASRQMLGELANRCSGLFKLQADGTMAGGKDLFGMMKSVANCLGSSVTDIVAKGVLSKDEGDILSKNFALMARLGQFADLGDRLLESYIGWQDRGPNVSFSVALGDKPAPAAATGQTTTLPIAQPVPVTTGPGTTPTVPTTPANRTAITSYDRMAPGAPHHGYFDVAWQPFVAGSNTVSTVSATVGSPAFAAGGPVPASLTLRLCASQPDAHATCQQVAQGAATIVNYGESTVDLGDIAVTPGATYWLEAFQPAAINGQTWVTYWWSGGDHIVQSDQLQMTVRGYNR